MATVDTTQTSVSSPTIISLAGRLRAARRLGTILGWTVLCWLILKMTAPVAVFSKRFQAGLGKAVTKMWIKGVCRVIGLRVVVCGELPKDPYFLVSNHLAWLDFFGAYSVLDALAIVEDPMRKVPLIGALMTALDPIFVRRVKEDMARVKGLMVEAIRRGRSVMMAPETPETTLRRGTGVRQFRGGLLDAAVLTGKAVNYASITFRTPKGCMPPSKALIFGPNPFLPTADGKLPESEYAMFERQTFFQHLMKVFALPYFEFVFTFGKEPIFAEDRIELANRLHTAVSNIFTPIE